MDLCPFVKPFPHHLAQISPPPSLSTRGTGQITIGVCSRPQGIGQSTRHLPDLLLRCCTPPTSTAPWSNRQLPLASHSRSASFPKMHRRSRRLPATHRSEPFCRQGFHRWTKMARRSSSSTAARRSSRIRVGRFGHCWRNRTIPRRPRSRRKWFTPWRSTTRAAGFPACRLIGPA